MKINRFHKIIVALLAMLPVLHSCTKDALDKKASLALVVPSTINDYQLLLDGLSGGLAGYGSFMSLGDYMSDNDYISDAQYLSFSDVVKGVYRWDNTMFTSAPSIAEWNTQYKNVLVTNLALEGLQKITPDYTSINNWKNVKGSALLIRANMFYSIASFWAKPYLASTNPNTDLGVVLRLSSDPNI